MTEKTGILKAVNSRPDVSGNRYFFLEYYDFKTEKIVRGQVSGGESNIYGILRHWNCADDWDRSVIFERQEMKIRDFDKIFKTLEYAGCRSEDLADFIRRKLAE